MTIRTAIIGAIAALMLLGGCGEQRSGPIVVSAIGAAPRLVNPNLRPLDPASAFLATAVAQGLVHFDATGQIEPALAQSWIVSDDGLRYTFRLARLEWSDGKPITAEQVVTRLQAAQSRASRNVLKPQLGVIEEIEAMTDDVLEITLKAPRPNFLQLLAQPEMAIIRNDAGTGPYRAERQSDGSWHLDLPSTDESETDEPAEAVEIILRGERTAMAVARFAARGADLVIGGTAGDLPIARAADLAATALRFEPVEGLFGLQAIAGSGPPGDVAVRRALAMAVDREALVDELDVPSLQPREALVPQGTGELAQPALPDWNALPLLQRREQAARDIATAASPGPLPIRVAMPDKPGYRVVFVHLRRDWRAIGVDARRVSVGEAADLRLVDAVAPTTQAAWYLRRFSCQASRVCLKEADALLDSARNAQSVAERQQALAGADRLLTDAALFIPLSGPVRWSLASARLTGFQPNLFAQHQPASLLAPRR